MRITAYGGVILIVLLCPAAHSQQKSRGVDPFRQFVTALPPIDRVEVEAVTPFLTDDLKDVDCTRTDLRCDSGRFPLKRGEVKTLTGDVADKLSVIWRKLKQNFQRADPYNPKGCFVPDHILRFYQGDKLVLETEVCIFCQLITLPKAGILNVSGSMEMFSHLQDFLMPDSKIEQEHEKFKREMMPKVGQRLTVMGFVGGGKPAVAVVFEKGAIYIHRMNLSEENHLINLGCKIVVKATGTLRFYEPPHQQSIFQQNSPEHFYFDDAEIKVISFEPWKRSKRTQRER